MEIIDIIYQIRYALEILGISFGFMAFYLVLAFNGYDMKIILYFWAIYMFFGVVVAMYNSFIEPDKNARRKVVKR